MILNQDVTEIVEVRPLPTNSIYSIKSQSILKIVAPRLYNQVVSSAK